MWSFLLGEKAVKAMECKVTARRVTGQASPSIPEALIRTFVSN
jgi:hypothetical protein